MASIDIESVLSQLHTFEGSGFLSGRPVGTLTWDLKLIDSQAPIHSTHTRSGGLVCHPYGCLTVPTASVGLGFSTASRRRVSAVGPRLGATWNAQLLTCRKRDGSRRKGKGAHVILWPTVNMQRSPLGGRAFESLSEDSVPLSMACKSEKLIATIKPSYTNGTIEEIGKIDVEAGKTYNVKVEFGGSSTCKMVTAIADIPGGGLRIGVAKTLEPELEIKVVETPKLADQVIFTTRIPTPLSSCSPHAGRNVMDSEAKAVVEVVAWYGDNETGNGVEDILIFGDVNPSGRLPLSLPRQTPG
ncbi:hypothetical protein V1523DRAFT_427742 [Lipomyces doorenjongii]